MLGLGIGQSHGAYGGDVDLILQLGVTAEHYVDG